MAGPLPGELRTYRLLQLGITLAEIDAAPALRLDELLAIHDVYRQVEAEAESKGAG